MSEGEKRFLQECPNWSVCHRLWSMRCPMAEYDPWEWCDCEGCFEFEDTERGDSHGDAEQG